MNDQLPKCDVYLFINSSLNVRIACFVKGQSREEIINQRHEERFIFIHQFGQVHVPQNSHHNCWLTVLRVGPLVGSQGTQYGQDVPQTKIIMDLETEKVKIRVNSYLEIEKVKRRINSYLEMEKVKRMINSYLQMEEVKE